MEMERSVMMLGDNRESLKTLPENSADLIVTSPPYWDIKKYAGGEDDIGKRQTIEEFEEDMRQVFAECYRVLKPGKYCCSVIRDVTKKRRCYPLHCSNVKVAESAGFVLEDMKYVLLLAHAHYDIILMFRKGEPEKPWKMVDKYDEPIWDLRRDKEKKFPHPAAFKTSIPRVLISKWTSVGGVVLDPFGGTGTTAVAAKELDRRSIYMELNPEYFKIAKDRIDSTKQGVQTILGDNGD